MGKVMRAIGLMSGTSMDGIDVAMIETDGEDVVRPAGARTYAYDDNFRRKLAAAILDAQGLSDRRARSGCLGEVEAELTERHADTVAAFLAEEGISRGDVGLIGFHGQTVLHRPEARLTIQLGDGPQLAHFTGLPVVHDLRAADVAAGGQGAPLAPVYHRALVSSRSAWPIAVLNIGGVANVTWIGADGELIAFDTGPGNALLDDWMAKRCGCAYDMGGTTALAGRVDERVVSAFLDHPYFSAPPPKSLDRNAFRWDAIDALTTTDGAATLAAISIGAVLKGGAHFPAPPAAWIVCGGGRKNAALMTMLRDRAGAEVLTAEDAGFDGDSIEAEAWAYLAVRSHRGLPITFPATTGVSSPTTGGILSLPSGTVGC